MGYMEDTHYGYLSEQLIVQQSYSLINSSYI